MEWRCESGQLCLRRELDLHADSHASVAVIVAVLLFTTVFAAAAANLVVVAFAIFFPLIAAVALVPTFPQCLSLQYLSKRLPFSFS